jgi:multiple sugar transport system substrate-binding protein
MANKDRSHHLSRRQFVGMGVGAGAAAIASRTGSSAAPASSLSGSGTLRLAQTGSAAKPKGTIRYPIWIGQSDTDAWNEVVKRFEKVNPDVKIKFEPFQFEQYWQKLNTQFAAGDAPAVCGMHVGLVYKYAEKKQLTELGALIERDGFKVDQIFPNLVEEGHWPKTGQAGLYMLPWRFVGSAFYVNKTILDQHGIAIPKDGWTWDDWVQIAKEAHDEKAGIYGSGLPANQLQQAQFMQAGAFGPLDETLTKSNFLDPGIQEAVQFIADLALKHKVAPRPQDVPQSAGGVTQDLFLSGKIALHPSASWNIPAYRGVKFEWDVVPQPMHKAKGAYSGPDGIGIPADSDNVDAAWAWVKFVTSEVAAQEVLGTTGLPVLKDYALSEGYISPEVAKGPASYGMLINELTTLGRGYGFNASWFEWTRESNQIFEQIYNGKVGVEDGLKQIDQKVTEIVNRPQ